MEQKYRGRYCIGIDKLKFFLIPFVCFNALGFPGSYGGFVQILSGFVAPCFFVLCGFLVLSRDRERRKEKLCHAVKRTGLLFLLMLGLYLVANIVYCSLQGIPWLEMLADMKKWVYFIALNEWPLPMGDTIWFIHALFYAYLFLLLINKWMDKTFVRRTLLVVCIVFMLVTGEFAVALGIQMLGGAKLLLLGKAYLLGGMITRALPYLLIGGLLREKWDKLFYIPPFIYPILAVICIVGAFIELWVLSEGGFLVDRSHCTFMGLTAIMLACWAIIQPKASADYVARHGRGYSKWIYVMFQIVDMVVIILVSRLFPMNVAELMEFEGLLVFGICLAGAVTLNTIKKIIWAKQNAGINETENAEIMDDMEGLGEMEGVIKKSNTEETDAIEEGWELEGLEDA